MLLDCPFLREERGASPGGPCPSGASDDALRFKLVAADEICCVPLARPDAPPSCTGFSTLLPVLPVPAPVGLAIYYFLTDLFISVQVKVL